MRKSSILHIPGTVDACPLDGWMHLRFRVQRGKIKSAKLVYHCDKNMWHQTRNEASMTVTFTDSELEYYSAAVPLTDTRFAYIFELECSDGIRRYLSEEGLTERFDHSLGYFHFFQYTSQFPCDMVQVPEWVKGAVCYQIFPERFAMGDLSKDTSYVNRNWGELPDPKSFYGGDLRGIQQKLPYLKELGFNVLYMTPVFCSPTNHKYEITDYEQVDPTFGGNAALKDLIEDAHHLKIRVLMDGVFNHCSWQHPFFLDARKRGTDSPWYDWFFWEPDGSYKTFGSVKYMPKLNTGNPEVIRYFTGVAVKWMREYGVDGWRLDVSDEISHRFLRAFRETVTAQNQEAIIIGEDWHRAVRYLNGDEYDGTMNYSLTKALLDLLAFEAITPTVFCDRLIALYHTYNVATVPKMLNLLGSHDTDRFLSRVHGDGQRFRTASAIQFFFPGIPCVYYADENGMEGGYDPDCRRCFDWDETSWDQETHRLIQSLAALKKGPALSRGSFRLTERNGILTFTRSADNQTAILRVNGTNYENEEISPFGFEIQVI